MRIGLRATIFVVFCCLSVSAVFAGDTIPQAAWKRPIGVPLPNAGTKKPALNIIDDGFWQGSPVGGLGAGTFSRSYRGDFSRWHLKSGVHKYQSIDVNQFSMFQKAEGSAQGFSQVLAAYHPSIPILQAWNWDYPAGAGDYYALYPKSWFDYRSPKFPAHVMLEQFSPILPDNYKESSYPVAVYRWHAENPTDHAVTVSIMFSWANMLGWLNSYSRDFSGMRNHGNRNRSFAEAAGSQGTMKGVILDRNRFGPVRDEWDGQFVLASLESPGVDISYQTTFNVFSDGSSLWSTFSKDGTLKDSPENWVSSGEPLASAIAVRFTLKPGEKRTIPMVLAWDLPIVEFGSGRKWYRHYTDFYGTEGTHGWNIAKDALLQSSAWSDAIDAWQGPYVNDASKPLWYRGELFNELYILADGGSLWGRPVDSDPKTPHSFAFMECFDYPYYATLDVRFYGSLPLLKFWPEIDKQVLKQFADTVPQDSPDKYVWEWKSEQTHALALRTRKAKGSVPHDLGVPEEDPIFQVNQFSWQNTTDWKDLNSKYVLMVWRDYVFSGRKDVAFLRYTWPSVKEAIEYLRKYDHDGDGIPENDGFPDQTYDEWVVRGESAYCGSLWLAALRAGEEMAKTLGDTTTAVHYRDLFVRSQASFIKKLWNGSYFRYDTGSDYRDSIQAEQLAGQWYATMTGLGDLVPSEMQRGALQKVFDNNVMKFGKGEMGAVNGIGADGAILHSNEQVQEVWTGSTFGVAALMLANGMHDQAFHTAWGVYHVVYETKGYWFRTPEAYDETGNYRASMYMRPAGIWAMEMTKPPK